MGGPNVDFFIREVRESLQGDMLVIRLAFSLSLCQTRIPVFYPHLCKAGILRLFDRFAGWVSHFT